MEQQQQDEQTGTLHLLELTPLFASHATPWVIKLEKELLILHADDGRIVMMLPQQDAARHLRFNRTLSGSYILSCVVVEGKAYRFNCSRANAHYLSQWLPQKPVETLREEVRRYGIAFILLGAALLLFPRLFFWGWGLTFILLGVLNVLLPYQKIHLLNALCMLSIAPIPLYFKPALGVAPGAPYDWILVASTGLGSLLIMWSIQQCALLGINHRIHAAHSCRLPATEEILPPSKAVRYILYTTLIFLLLLIGHLVGLFLQQYYTTPPPDLRDWVVYISLAMVTFGIIIVLRFRSYKSYLEARIAGNYLILLSGLYLTGLFHTTLANALPFPSELIWNGLFAVGNPRMWLPLLVAILLFNHWFSRAIEKELRQFNI